MNEIPRLACSYAALILHDEGLPISSERLQKIIKAANIEISPSLIHLYSKFLESHDVQDFLFHSETSETSALQRQLQTMSKIEQSQILATILLLDAKQQVTSSNIAAITKAANITEQHRLLKPSIFKNYATEHPSILWELLMMHYSDSRDKLINRRASKFTREFDTPLPYTLIYHILEYVADGNMATFLLRTCSKINYSWNVLITLGSSLGVPKAVIRKNEVELLHQKLWKQVCVRRWKLEEVGLNVNDWFGFFKRRYLKLEVVARNRNVEELDVLAISGCDLLSFHCPNVANVLADKSSVWGSDRYCDICQKTVHAVKHTEDLSKFKGKDMCIYYAVDKQGRFKNMTEEEEDLDDVVMGLFEF